MNKITKKSIKQNTQVSEDELFKALGVLEGEAAETDEEEFEKADAEESDESDESEEDSDEPVGKAHTAGTPGMPDDTDEANGGLADEGDLDGDLNVNADEKDPTGASMKSLVQDSGTLNKAFEVSEFLEELTGIVAQSVDGLAKSNAEFANEQRAFNARIQKAIVAMGNMVLNLRKSVDGIDEAPVSMQPRSVLRKSEAVERFEQSADAPRYSRAQTLDALSSLVEKGGFQPYVVSAYESTGYIDPQMHTQLSAELKSLFGS